MGKKIFLLFSIFLLVTTSIISVTAAPPETKVSYYPEGYKIKEQQYHIFRLGEPLRYGFFLTNTTSGKIVNNTLIDYCRIVISNSKGFNTRVHEINYNETYMLWGLELNETQVLETFPKLGYYNYGVSCQDGKGDVISGIFEITPSGYTNSTHTTIISSVFLLILLILLILVIRAMVITNSFGWTFGYLNIAYLLINIFFYLGWKIFYNFLYSIPEIGTALHSMWVVSNIIWIPFVLGQVAYILITMTEESQIKKLIKMGYSENEAASRIKRNKR